MKAFMHKVEVLRTCCTQDFIFYCSAGDIPCVKVLKEKHFPTVKQERENSLREKVRGKHVAVLCDEPTDSRDAHALETANAENCSRAILDTLKTYNVDFDSVLVSDSAKCMVKCF
ncbi:hypothetical protein PR048_017225 [Dryococelus australis]|uniref:Uncharacterized protein n=1 Tax=Dryococelus australis TaxID=614101 RepID=A0ABQ9H8X3_9NEOP|nr:hypothetical protein PR048_017225 [Dryococelus australis]